MARRRLPSAAVATGGPRDLGLGAGVAGIGRRDRSERDEDLFLRAVRDGLLAPAAALGDAGPMTHVLTRETSTGDGDRADQAVFAVGLARPEELAHGLGRLALGEALRDERRRLVDALHEAEAPERGLTGELSCAAHGALESPIELMNLERVRDIFTAEGSEVVVPLDVGAVERELAYRAITFRHGSSPPLFTSANKASGVSTCELATNSGFPTKRVITPVGGTG